MAVMIEIGNLVKRFGPLTAVDDVSFSVERGEVLGFLGPNGAGKSTTMKMVTGFLTPTSGSISVCGHDVARAPLAAKRTIGYLPEGAPAYPDMTPAAYLDFVADIRRLKGAAKRERLGYVIARIGLEGVLQQPIDTLSKGYKRRVGLAQALIHDPQVLVLDEPTDGLDPNQKHEVRGLIREIAADKAIVISTHILEEVEAVCRRALIIDNGRIVADGTPSELQARSRYHNAVVLTVNGAEATVAEAIGGIEGVARLEAEGEGRFVLFPEDGAAIVERVSARARERGLEVVGLQVEAGRLDEVFRAITTGDEGAGPGGGR
jgi:ABC-2 type transport system ATP-binding protein